MYYSMIPDEKSPRKANNLYAGTDKGFTMHYDTATKLFEAYFNMLMLR